MGRFGRILAAVPLLAVLTLAGCSHQASTVLGSAPRGGPAPVAAALAAPAGKAVTLHGVMVEKCPVAGCWFKLRDSSGLVKVDTKASGFVVLDVPTGATMTVAGKTVGAGPDRMVSATGLVY